MRKPRSNFQLLRTPALLLVLALLSSACSSLALRGVNLLAPDFAGTTINDVAYGDRPRQRLDLYLPAVGSSAAGVTSPLLVFVYGGAWQQGARSQYRWAGEALASMGLATAVPDYRVYPQVRFPDFVIDVAQALPAALRTCRQQGACDGRSVILLGHSAGAHIAALLALDPTYLDDMGVDIHGWVGLAGPYDFLPLTGRLVQVFKHAGGDEDTQPIRYTSADDPPVLLLHGDDDGRVEPRNSAALASALDQAGVPVRYHSLAGASHSAVLVGLADNLQEETGVRKRVCEFIDSLLEPTAQSTGLNCQP